MPAGRWWPTSCCRNPAEPVLPGRRAAHAAGRGTDCGASSWRCAGKGQAGRCSQGCRSWCTQPQGPEPGTAYGRGPRPAGTALRSGTPCPPGTELDGKTEWVSAWAGGKGQEREGREEAAGRGPRSQRKPLPPPSCAGSLLHQERFTALPNSDTNILFFFLFVKIYFYLQGVGNREGGRESLK